MTIFKLSFIVLMSLAHYTSAFSYPKGHPSIEQDACVDDFNKLKSQKLCETTCQSIDRMACLIKNESKLSESCKKSSQQEKKDWQKKNESYNQLIEVCKDELKDAETPIMCQKDMLFHLMINKEKVGEKCKKITNEHIEAHLPGIKKI